jgi:elongation factor P
MVLASELKSGMVLRIDNEIYRVLEAEFKAGSAKLNGVVKTQLNNVLTGGMWDRNFRPQERLEDVQLEQRSMEFLFSGVDSCTFMNPDTFEQLEVPRSIVGTVVGFLHPGMMVPIQFFEARPISIQFPEIADARVAKTAPAAHSHQDNAWKDATLENGQRIQVPLFIAPGELVRVEVKTGRYISRSRGEHRQVA